MPTVICNRVICCNETHRLVYSVRVTCPYIIVEDGTSIVGCLYETTVRYCGYFYILLSPGAHYNFNFIDIEILNFLSILDLIHFITNYKVNYMIKIGKWGDTLHLIRISELGSSILLQPSIWWVYSKFSKTCILFRYENWVAFNFKNPLKRCPDRLIVPPSQLWYIEKSSVYIRCI